MGRFGLGRRSSGVVVMAVVAALATGLLTATGATGAAADTTSATPSSSATTATVKTTPATPAAAINTSCPDVILLGARGSGEPAQVNGAEVFDSLGPNVWKIADVARSTFGSQISFATVPIVYPADGFTDFLPSPAEVALLAAALLPAPVGPIAAAAAAYDYWQNHWNAFFGSIQAGADAVVAETQAQAKQCPNSALILAGYSQGAMAVHDGEKNLLKAGDTATLSHVAGTILLADGDRVTNTNAVDTFGTSTHSGQGARSVYLLNSWGDVWDGPNTANICNDGDAVCDFSLVSLYSGLVTGKILTHSRYTTCPTGSSQICGTGTAMTPASITAVSPALVSGAAYIANRVNAKFPHITSTAVATGKVGTGYLQAITATGGDSLPLPCSLSGYRWSALDALPAGLTLSPTCGVVTGTPKKAGTSTVRVQVADKGGRTATLAIKFTITA